MCVVVRPLRRASPKKRKGPAVLGWRASPFSSRPGMTNRRHLSNRLAAAQSQQEWDEWVLQEQHKY